MYIINIEVVDIAESKKDSIGKEDRDIRYQILLFWIRENRMVHLRYIKYIEDEKTIQTKKKKENEYLWQ